MTGTLSRIILKLFGWQIKPVGEFPIKANKCVLAVAPHTSGWDFIIGVLYRSALGLTKARFIGKMELFKPPFGFLFYWLGGIPVDRSRRQNMVSEVAGMFAKHDELMIALSPEGTRQRVDQLKTGFYNIAKIAQVPIVMIALDFEHKRLLFSKPMVTTNNMEADLQEIVNFFAPVKGKIPERGLTHLSNHKINPA